MANAEKDPIVEALEGAARKRRPTKCEEIFADRPEVLDSIRKAHYRRKLSYKQIADILSKNSDIQIGDGAVRNYLLKVGDFK